MHQLTAFDVVLMATLAASVILLAKIYIKQPYFTSSAQNWVALGGICWILYAGVSELVSAEVLDVPWMDARYHFYKASELLREYDRLGIQAFTDYFRRGNHAFHCYNAVVISMGASIWGLTAIHGWLTFWGGLILARNFASVGPFPANRPIWLFLTVFCPSVIFWCTANLKEGLIFWSICAVYSVSFKKNALSFAAITPIVGIGLVVGTCLRPHVMVGWLASIFMVDLLTRGRRLWAFVMLIPLIPVAYAFLGHIGGPITTDSMLDFAETQFDNLAQVAGQGSRIGEVGGRSIFLVSGILSAFFRPFPWEIGSLRLLLGSLEVWGMTIFIAAAWLKSPKFVRAAGIRLPGIGVAILASIWMCLLLTYYPNEGLVFRQRTQMIPALLALAVLPRLVLESTRARLAALGLLNLPRLLSKTWATPVRRKTPLSSF